jgi:hypothetical protein
VIPEGAVVRGHLTPTCGAGRQRCAVSGPVILCRAIKGLDGSAFIEGKLGACVVDHVLLTIRGAGGVAKTRLAL